MKTATIVGAGLVGSLWAVYLSKAGYKLKYTNEEVISEKQKYQLESLLIWLYPLEDGKL